VALGACLAVLPFVLEYRAAARLAETGELETIFSKIQNVEQLAAQIGYATSQWQTVRECADKTAGAAQKISDRMAAEVKEFSEFLQRSNDGEKAALRLETEKLRRGETEWLQVVVRMLDHVHALHRAAEQSRQPGLIEQIGLFQNACRDAARRVGLTPFAPAPEEPFDAQRHQLMEGEARPESGAVVAETVATGYTFQGQLLRPALVRLRTAGTVQESDSGQNILPLEQP
jgi:molecular chaperone GrpE (heat shock protein)